MHITEWKLVQVLPLKHMKDIFKIFENSEAVLDLDSQEKSINLKSGAISNLIKKLDALRDKFRPRYTVATAIAVAGVRGTAFFVKVEDNKKHLYLRVQRRNRNEK